jgi:hypothetical protein
MPEPVLCKDKTSISLGRGICGFYGGGEPMTYMVLIAFSVCTSYMIGT